MLTRIREKLSSWVIALLLLFIAIPLVFMGLGNYQSASDSYAFKINDQVITTSQLEQEVFQYRQALESNNQGSLPPFYTNKFIRNITMDYMLNWWINILQGHSTQMMQMYLSLNTKQVKMIIDQDKY